MWNEIFLLLDIYRNTMIKMLTDMQKIMQCGVNKSINLISNIDKIVSQSGIYTTQHFIFSRCAAMLTS